MSITFSIKSTIDDRRSARSYRMKPVDQDVMDAIKNFARAMPIPFDHHTEIRFFHADPTKVLYPFMKSPPDNIAFVAETDRVSISKAGFVGELLILYAQSKELASCWYGHYKLAELERLMPHLQSPDQLNEANKGFGYSRGETTGVRAICITPLGYYEDNGLRLMDRITEKTISHKRKEIIELLEHQDDLCHLSDDILYALDLGRKAPSAGNSQMWRFGFEDSFNTITVAMPPGYQHFKWEHPNVDIGICACHVWLGLLDRGWQPTVKVSEIAGRAVWKISIA
ncbi:MAG: nitroreductase family protein [Acetobacterium sp.]|uniref:nitroreductase family protein n=1 Tax=Acetobacterium sp. TaxID=1872094 RepID=UPI0032427C5C